LQIKWGAPPYARSIHAWPIRAAQAALKSEGLLSCCAASVAIGQGSVGYAGMSKCDIETFSMCRLNLIIQMNEILWFCENLITLSVILRHLEAE
jgi:hypothetical protein